MQQLTFKTLNKSTYTTCGKKSHWLRHTTEYQENDPDQAMSVPLNNEEMVLVGNSVNLKNIYISVY